MRNKKFEYICRKTQSELHTYAEKKLKEIYAEVISERGFVYAKGDVPLLLVAHMDTVHKSTPQTIEYIGDVVSSPNGIGGDDRCGVYAVMEIIKKHKCSVLFTEDEEIGGIGAACFIKSPKANELSFNYIIELDRQGKNDAVFYDCDNAEFTKFICGDGTWKEKMGSFSDISIIAPRLKCAAVNLSCGYYKAHTKEEYVNLKELEMCIVNVCKLIERTKESDKFEYIESANYFNFFENWGGYKSETFKADEGCALYGISFVNAEWKEDYEEYYASSEAEAIGFWAIDYPDVPSRDILAVDCFGVDSYVM